VKESNVNLTPCKRPFLIGVFYQDDYYLYNNNTLNLLSEGNRLQFLLLSCLFDRLRYCFFVPHNAGPHYSKYLSFGFRSHINISFHTVGLQTLHVNERP
jgi:hypothetical protein